GSTWLVYSDQASHAAMSGQFMLEQTFYLPVTAMLHEQRAPLRVLENALGRSLV
nr:Kdo hydroxylase family protein [Pseudomonadota bacterium]